MGRGRQAEGPARSATSTAVLCGFLEIEMETIQDTRLPKARLFWVQWQGWWFGQLRDALHMERRYWPAFWMTTRGANFWQAWLGPVQFGWRRPWLRGPAEQHLKQHYGDA